VERRLFMKGIYGKLIGAALFAAQLALAPVLVCAQEKYALVIGNAAYTSQTPLRNTLNDATDMKAALEGLGFKTEMVLNGSLRQMNDAVRNLARNLGRASGSYGFFYYSGHGLQYNGENYLVPVDANLGSEADLPYEALNAQRMLDYLQEAGNVLNVVVLDACRNTPYGWSRNADKGLAVVGRQPPGSIIMYATGAGKTASDGTGRNGLFTAELLKHLKTPGLEVNEIFRRTGEEVGKVSNNQQTPALYLQFFGTVYLGMGPVQIQPAPQSAPPPAPATHTGSLRISSAVAGTVVVDGKDVGVSIKAEGVVTVEGVNSGWTEVGVRTGNALIGGPSVLVQAGQTASVRIERPVPDGFMRIPAGTFTMGSPASEAGRDGDEGPQHSVTVSGFYMSKYEITQKEWVEVMGSNPSYFKGDNLPVEQVTWYDAVEYCNKRSVKEGLTPAYTIDKTRSDPDNRNGNDKVKWVVTWNRGASGYRLPTEAEWEYACRAGTSGPFSTGNNITTSQANYDGNYPYNGNAKGEYRRKTWNVGSGTANSWGLYDMHGNVWEWCWDWYGSYTGGAQTDPVGASSGAARLSRGGGWFSDAQGARSAYRDGDTPSFRYGNLGFRLVRP
jgi:formylglycine-generating enzyme required for sulfatase activity